MGFLKSILAAIRGINLTAIGKTFLSGYGFFARLIGGFVLKSAEKILDKQIKNAEENLGVKEKDKGHAAQAKTKAEKINGAKTDEELDEAFRDSLR